MLIVVFEKVKIRNLNIDTRRRFAVAVHSRIDVAQWIHAAALRPGRRPPPIGRRLRQQPPR